ncbi:hypothetical protein NDI54_09980 [Haloarcula sp. S1AR25-5A]|uniref:Uncharacterized protein n=1 Tax=Haloarcula terrestris TaxID=2950533 RepID=A0AAE4JGP7_9EURY|nr:hypothetical protein [Haloarcula terrestris]MDS0221677.1 hypothetical protein [Haloarcula terrestris]
MERLESTLDDINRVRVDKLCWLMIDSRSAVVHLQMDWSKAVVGVILVPPDKKTAFGFDPIEPVIHLGIIRAELKSDFDSSSRDWILNITKELVQVNVSNDSVRTWFSWFGTPSTDSLEFSAEPILDPFVEPFALQVCSVSEKHDH